MNDFPKPKPLNLIELLWYRFRKLPFIIVLCRNNYCSMKGVAYPYPHWGLTEDVCPVCKQKLIYAKELERFLRLNITEENDTENDCYCTHTER